MPHLKPNQHQRREQPKSTQEHNHHDPRHQPHNRQTARQTQHAVADYLRDHEHRHQRPRERLVLDLVVVFRAEDVDGVVVRFVWGGGCFEGWGGRESILFVAVFLHRGGGDGGMSAERGGGMVRERESMGGDAVRLT